MNVFGFVFYDNKAFFIAELFKNVKIYQKELLWGRLREIWGTYGTEWTVLWEGEIGVETEEG